LAPIHRFAAELVRYGISSRAAAAIGNALMLDINDFNPITDLDNVLLDGNKIDR